MIGMWYLTVLIGYSKCSFCGTCPASKLKYQGRFWRRVDVDISTSISQRFFDFFRRRIKTVEILTSNSEVSTSIFFEKPKNISTSKFRFGLPLPWNWPFVMGRFTRKYLGELNPNMRQMRQEMKHKNKNDMPFMNFNLTIRIQHKLSIELTHWMRSSVIHVVTLSGQTGIFDQNMITGPFTDSVTTALRGKSINTPQHFHQIIQINWF